MKLGVKRGEKKMFVFSFSKMLCLCLKKFATSARTTCCPAHSMTARTKSFSGFVFSYSVIREHFENICLSANRLFVLTFCSDEKTIKSGMAVSSSLKFTTERDKGTEAFYLRPFWYLSMFCKIPTKHQHARWASKM